MRSVRRPSWAVFVLMSLLPLLSACGSDQSAPVPGSLILIGGDAQTAQVGTVLGQMLTVEVRDETGVPMSGITVSWTVAGGGGSVSAASSTTGAGGQTTTAWTLGGNSGAQSVRAGASGFTVTFTATGQAGPAARVAVTPGQSTLNALQATLQLTAEVQDAFGNPVGGDITWASGDEAVLTVDATGLATAVANGAATVTATSGALEGTAALTVAQAASTVVVTPEDPIIAIGGTQQLAAAASDANGNPIVGAAFTWSSSDDAVATVDAAGLVSAVVEGTATLTATSGNASGGVTVMVILVPLPFTPTTDQDVGGTMTVGELMIPAGVTITATSDLVINATGPVQIDGSLVGDCVAVSVDGAGSLTITGSVSNVCNAMEPVTTPSLTLQASEAIVVVGATIESSGDLTISNVEAGAAALRAGRVSFLRGRASARVPANCSYGSTKIFASRNRFGTNASGAFGMPKGEDGPPGKGVALFCSGDASLTGVTLRAGRGGDGGDGSSSVPGQTALGGEGAKGGSALIGAVGDIEFSVDPTSSNGTSIFGAFGGRGGRGSHLGKDAFAQGGRGGTAGRVVINAGGTIRINDPGALTISYQFGEFEAMGGRGMADAEDGADAGTVAAERGSDASALGGKGGGIGESGPVRLIGDVLAAPSIQGAENMVVTIEPFSPGEGASLGSGGTGEATGGNGGKGNEDFPDGGPGGNTTAIGGDGGDMNFLDNRGGEVFLGAAGSGGFGEFKGSNGGGGFNKCQVGKVMQGGKGGPGGDLIGQAGVNGFLGPNREGEEIVFFEDVANGGKGGDGIEPGTGGDPGTDGVAATKLESGMNLTRGDDGEACKTPMDIIVTVSDDPVGHDPFTLGSTMTMFTVMLGLNGEIEITGPEPWVTVRGNVSPDGEFTTTGIGTIASIPNVTVEFDGTLLLDEDGRVAGVTTGTLVWGANNELPEDPDTKEKAPVTYTVVGAKKPEES